jgi:hypothetical protein
MDRFALTAGGTAAQVAAKPASANLTKARLVGIIAKSPAVETTGRGRAANPASRLLPWIVLVPLRQ